MWARVPHPGSRPKNSRVIGLTTWVVNRRKNQSLVVAATVPPLLARSGGVCHRDLDRECVPCPQRTTGPSGNRYESVVGPTIRGAARSARRRRSRLARPARETATGPAARRSEPGRLYGVTTT